MNVYICIYDVDSTATRFIVNTHYNYSISILMTDCVSVHVCVCIHIYVCMHSYSRGAPRIE